MSLIQENKFKIPKRFGECTTNIWNEFTQLVTEFNPLNLGMGFPDYPPPKYVTNTLLNIVKDENTLLHQYTRDLGHPRLMKAIAKLYSPFLHREINPEKEILTSASGCQALYLAIMGLIDIDDEVIIIEPYFDFYETLVKIAGGKCKFIPLRSRKKDVTSSSDLSLDANELSSIFNEKTKLFILNTPNNPTGKVFKLEELETIADLCKKWNVICLSDEVYEFFVYAPNKHSRIASLPGMWERTITITCPGKTFGVTGWELGIIYGSQNLILNLQMIHQNLVSSSNTPIQEAFARLFEKETTRLHEDECIFNSLPRELVGKRDFIVEILRDAGFKPVVPEGGFLILADWTCLKIELNLEKHDYKDIQFAKWLIKNVGIAGIPTSAFYNEKNKHLGENYIRFCFLKKRETLEQFAKILKENVKRLKQA